MQRKGIILAGGSGTRLYPLTQALSKQLMPVYDKPMIYYPISVLMLAGIREILVISTPQDLPAFRQLLGTGEPFGLRFDYAEQPSPDGLAQAMMIGEDFLAGSPSVMILGDNLFYGEHLPASLHRANERAQGASIFAYHVANPSAYGIVTFDEAGKAVALEEKPLQARSNFAVPGIYFYDAQAPQMARSLKPSARGELEITDLNRLYLERGELFVEKLGRGTAWLDTGTHQSLLEAAQFVQVLENRQGLKIACLEEIALEQGWIDLQRFEENVRRMGKSSYATYLKAILDARREGAQ